MPLPEYFEFLDRTKLIYGIGMLEQAGAEAAALGGTRALIVTGSTAKQNGHLDRIRTSLADAGVEPAAVLDGIPVDSDVETVERGNQIAREAGCNITVAIGGGSVLDTAKAVNILLTEGGSLLEDHQGAYLQQRPLKPLIAIPTTAGSASEVTFAAVIKDRENHIKIGFISPYIAPDAGILDPELTVTMPPALTASTGMDALAHAVESLQSNIATPVSDTLALGAARMIARNLRRTVTDGSDMDARGRMLVASATAGLAVTNALLGITHGIAHSLGAVAGVPHGFANALLLPFGMEWNLDFCEKAFSDLAVAAFGSEDTGSERQNALKAIQCVRALSSEIGLPQSLRELGVSKDCFDAVAELTLGDGSLVTNPREVSGPEDILEILAKAY